MSRPGTAQVEYGLAAAAPNASLERLAETFALRPMQARAAIAGRFAAARQEFIAEAITLIRSGGNGQGRRYILTHLTETGAFLEVLVDRTLLTREQAVELMTAAMRMEPQFDIRLMRWLVDGANQELVRRLGSGAEALLEGLTLSSPGNRLLPVAVQLLRSQAGHVRSKAALLVAQRNQRVDLALADSDARVRANAIEALWGQRTPGARRALTQALEDGNNRVTGNAILGLFRMGDVSVVPRLLDMMRHPSPAFRSTAAWVMGQTADRAFLPRLSELAADADVGVAEAAGRALEAFERKEAVSAGAGLPEESLLRILRVTESGGGRRQLSAMSRIPKPPAELPATVKLACGGNEAPDAQMRYHTMGALALGLLLPDGWGQEMHEAVKHLLHHKADSDRMAMVSYQPGRPAPLAQNGKVAAPRVVYSLVPSVPSRTRNEPGPGMLLGAQSLLTAPTGLAAQANLVMLVAEAASLEMPGAPDFLMGIARRADQAGAFLHVIAAAELPDGAQSVLRAACGETGGYYFTCAGGGDYLKNAEFLLQILHGGIEVSYRDARPADGTVIELQIFSGNTIARARAECTKPPYRAQNGSTIWYC